MNSRNEGKGIWRTWTIFREKWIWHCVICGIRVIFWRNWHLKTSLPSLQNNYLKENLAALNASCTSAFSYTYFAEILYWTDIDLHLHSRLKVYLNCWKNCWLPSIIWGADFVLWDFHSWKFFWVICICCWITL